MKTVQVEVPDQVAAEMDHLVKSGWFADERELARRALIDFMNRERLALEERFQLEDIRWALGLRERAK